MSSVPPKTTEAYRYQKVIDPDGRLFFLPQDCKPGSRRWKFWLKWQQAGLPLPQYKPGITITRSGIGMSYTPYTLSGAAA